MEELAALVASIKVRLDVLVSEARSATDERITEIYGVMEMLAESLDDIEKDDEEEEEEEDEE